MKRLSLIAFMLFSPALLAAEGYIPGAPKDPTVRTAQFNASSGRYFSALNELLAIPSASYNSLPPSADYRWQLADDYLSFGMGDKAESLYRDLALVTTNHDALAKARLQLADFDFQRGYHTEARNILTNMRDKLPQALLEQWQDQTARGLLAQKRYSEAVDVLSKFDNASKQSAYTRFNLGVSLINAGRVVEGRDILDRVGRMSVETSADLALRDKANLTLGWHYLSNQLAENAKPVFRRIRSKGPFSNRALLGLGWAEMLPVSQLRIAAANKPEDDSPAPISTFPSLGQLLRPGFLDDTIFSRAFGSEKARLGNLNPEEEDALKRALVFWVELISRNPMDPAVHEGWLAIPYSLDRLGAHEQALKYYELAVSKLEDVRTRADQAKDSIRKGRMVETIVKRDIDAESGWYWELKELPDVPETYYLQSLLAEHSFQEALKNYRDVRLLGRNLDNWKSRLDVLESNFTGQGRPSVEPEALFKRAREGFIPPWPTPTIRLRLEAVLSAPGSYDDAIAATPTTKMPLKLGTPKRFDSPWEKLQTMKSRLTALRPIVSSAYAEQGRQLQDMAITELDGQKKQIEKYLVEARFALARLYDKQLKGELND